MENTQKLTIYTDGGSRGNPGEAAIGVIFKNAQGKTIKEYGEAIGVTTNNVAEYSAILFGLQKAKHLWGRERAKKLELEFRMDSQLAARQLNGEYKIEDNDLQPLFLKIWNLKIDFGKVTFLHVPREENKEADRLVNQALDIKSQKLF
jgi:ribonuclease HI